MGSLMAGWSSPVKDPKTVMYQRNRSLTRGEIDAYWESKKSEEGHIKEISTQTSQNQKNMYEGSGRRLERPNTMPLTDRSESSGSNGAETEGMNISNTKCWWTKSRWAFLNEAPVKAMDGPTYKYAAQYHLDLKP